MSEVATALKETPLFSVATTELVLRFVDIEGKAFVHCDIHTTNMGMFSRKMQVGYDALGRLKNLGYRRVHAFSLFENMSKKRLFLWTKIGGLNKLASNDDGVFFFREL